jgi:hypothetical protein
MKLHSTAIVREHTVQHERVQVDIEIQRPTEALHDHHGAAATLCDAVRVRESWGAAAAGGPRTGLMSPEGVC